MNMHYLRRLGLPVVLALVLVLSACGDSDDSPPQLVAPSREQPTATPETAPDSDGGSSAASAASVTLNADQVLTIGNGSAGRVAWSPDGTWLALEGTLGTWRWDMTDDDSLPTRIEGWHGLPVFDPSGAWAVIQDEAGAWHLWDTAADASAAVLIPAGEGVAPTRLTFSANGDRLAAWLRPAGATDYRTVNAGEDLPPLDPGTIRLWDLSDPDNLAAPSDYTPSDPRVLGMRFTPDGTLIAAGSADNLPIWVVSENGWISTFNNSVDMTIRLWDVVAGERISALDGLLGPSDYVAFSQDGSRVAATWSTAVLERYRLYPILIWDVRTGEVINEADEDNASPARWIAFSPDGETLFNLHTDYFSAEDRWQTQVWLWDVASGARLDIVSDNRFMSLGTDRSLYDPALSPNGRRLAAASMTGSLWVWNLAQPDRARTIDFFQAPTNALAFSPDSNTLAAGGLDGITRLWDVASGERLRDLGDTLGPVNQLLFRSDGALLVTKAYGINALWLWDITTGEVLDHITTSGQQRWQTVSVSPDGAWIGTSTGDQMATLRDVSSGSQKPISTGQRVASLAFSPDGTLVAAGSVDGLINFWDVPPGTMTDPPAATLTGHTGPVTHLTFSADGNTLVSMSSYAVETVRNTWIDEAEHALPDRTLRVWDISAGVRGARTVQELSLDEYPDLGAGVVSPDGTVMAAADSEGTIRFWSLHSGALVLELPAHTGLISTLAFNADGTLLASSGDDGQIHVWRLGTD